MNNQTKVNEIIKQLEGRAEQQTLSPRETWSSDIDAAIATLEWNEKTNDPAVISLVAGLHLWNDNLHTSHSHSQQIEGEPTGDYWHAIMHRMEQDYGNSKYWFLRAGNHPVKQLMPQKATEFLQKHAEAVNTFDRGTMVNILQQFKDKQGWNSDDFVDLIKLQENNHGTEATRRILEGLQQIELRTLVDFTYRKVFG